MVVKDKKALAYFPGCSLHSTANDFSKSIKLLMEILEIELKEIEDWCCCGASSAHRINQHLANGLVKLNIDQCKKMGLDTIFAPCAACFNRFKVVVSELGDTTKIVSLPDLISKHLEEIKIKQKLKLNMKIACYYGCLLNKPHSIFKQDCENPMTMEQSLTELGMESIEWPFKTECCGASFSLSNPEVVYQLTGEILRKAQQRGAEIIVTSCPLCHVNLDMRQKEIIKRNNDITEIPVLYLSELIAICVGIPIDKLKIDAHFIQVSKTFEEKFTVCHG
ncbi:MAG: hypothetical protein A2504_15310 [Bdellovibrionales bacterium RIFOXYD12_FULL_39_22]|nr:MAG: hypothetical protein A2385_02740 [Bdellovibrionales bacterium RIFOXYB1_FULL_39_21]OFZ43164.1 MAG: hypothetical protein A2485_11885 [Bdellovibrionales bacterium RIFOXYC12_FULL_39_17]OFZ47902.1 MAG: hypothetical protein A2404_16525 [Bdellovibrionales bacterium RIFOXYC1_FULL_39_130]OFZ75682.1 MAG: hypothetical protein A2560_13025 [Bdellovibrionales bacterium RIFOXYD1_FULL_39_84]OFZ94172.1 MAG: hypothetical protein A2504_15310 [Bdellovibrionales bacterium RIFOXYD12_FULL_39_22]HLE11762.1 he